MLKAFKILFQRYCKYSFDIHLHWGQAKMPQVVASVFVDDRGFLDKSEYYGGLLHNIDRGLILCKLKLKHPPPSFDKVDPAFFWAYDKSTHGAHFRKDPDLSYLDLYICDQVYALIQKY
jgi:hypothetical protein